MNYHILNGDALKERWPASFSGKTHIMRECLVDGEISQTQTLAEFLNARATFLAVQYPQIPFVFYEEEVKPEITKILALPPEAEINLWFEDDLFCQVNFWFLLAQLHQRGCKTLYLVRPLPHFPYSFAHLSNEELREAFAQRIALEKYAELFLLWDAYQKNDRQKLQQLAAQLESTLPFVTRAIAAHLARFPQEKGDLGRPKNTIRKIIQRTGAEDFGAVFRAFCAEEAIYGFGDLQVFRLWEEVKKSLRG
jgi:hypothetical protein